MSSHAAESDLIKDRDNPKSLVNLTPTVVASRITAIPEDVFLLSVEELEVAGHIGDTERKMRAAFTQEHERSLRTGDQMLMSNVYKGITTHSYFHRYIVGNSYKLAYVIKPFADYQASLEDMLQLGLDEMRKILKQPMVDAKGNFDTKLAAVKINLFKDLADRRRGSAAKKLEIDSKSMNLNITKDVTETPESMEAIEQRLKELEATEVLAISHKDVTDHEQEV